ncbi:MAG: helix-turn-helix domain-containing protein [Spirochaetota bacterium]|jgi:transcriptional regulator with XRE-family HTH domain|nr:helix-turn-helix domain-containing protein [Spirochaetota bacterium]
MLTAFGIALRKIRLDRGEILKTMADTLEISSSYLSAIETGTRNIPDDFINRLSALYHLDADKVQELKNAQLESQKEVVVGLEGATLKKRDTALIFARSFSDIDEQTAEKIKRLLKNSIKGE